LTVARQIEQRAVVEHSVSHCFGDLAQHLRARVAHLVDAVTESHDAAAGGELTVGGLKWLADDRMKMIENNCRPKRLTRLEFFKLDS